MTVRINIRLLERIVWVTEIRRLAEDAQPALIHFADAEIACGFPSPSQDYLTSEIDLNEFLLPHRVSMYIMRARGHSMTQAGIHDGDEVIVDRAIAAEDGHVVVVAVVDGEMTIERLRLTPGGGVLLAAEQPGHPDILVAELGDLRVWGVVTRSLHYVRRT